MGIELKSISKAFGDKVIFSDFSYSFSDRGIYTIKGESGSGKTTLLRMISGLDGDFTGSIIHTVSDRCAVVFQEYRLFPTLSALDNVIYANYDKKTYEIIKEARMILNSLGLSDEDIMLRPCEMSGGMKQRTSIARALLSDAPTLLLDEATKELDRENATAVLEIIKREGEKRLVILISHSESEVEYLGATVINIDEIN